MFQDERWWMDSAYGFMYIVFIYDLIMSIVIPHRFEFSHALKGRLYVQAPEREFRCNRSARYAFAARLQLLARLIASTFEQTAEEVFEH